MLLYGCTFSHSKELFQNLGDFYSLCAVHKKTWEVLKTCSKILSVWNLRCIYFPRLLLWDSSGFLFVYGHTFLFREAMEPYRLIHGWTRVSRYEKLMYSETVLVNTLEYKGDTLGETQQEFFIFCSFPACSFCSRSKPHWTATLRLLFSPLWEQSLQLIPLLLGLLLELYCPSWFLRAGLQSKASRFAEGHLAIN